MKSLPALAISALMLLTVAPAPADADAGGHVTFAEYQAVQPGWSRWHTQHRFGTTGHLVVMYATGSGRRHIIRDYPTDTPFVEVRIEYVGRHSQHRMAGPVHVLRKALVNGSSK